MYTDESEQSRTKLLFLLNFFFFFASYTYMESSSWLAVRQVCVLSCFIILP